MATFLTDLIKKGYTQDEIFAVIFESEREKKRRRMQAIVTETVNAHRLEKIKKLLAYKKLATWRRMNGFDRVVEGEESWFHGHRLLPPTPEQHTASLRFELKKLKDAISMPAENTVTRPWQETIDFVDELKGTLPDEELAVIKRYVEKWSREAAQAQVTVTQECFNDWEGRGYDDSVPGEVTKTTPSGDRTTRSSTWSASLPRIQLISSGGWSNKSPGRVFLVPSPPKTGRNL